MAQMEKGRKREIKASHWLLLIDYLGCSRALNPRTKKNNWIIAANQTIWVCFCNQNGQCHNCQTAITRMFLTLALALLQKYTITSTHQSHTLCEPVLFSIAIEYVNIKFAVSTFHENQSLFDAQHLTASLYKAFEPASIGFERLLHITRVDMWYSPLLLLYYCRNIASLMEQICFLLRFWNLQFLSLLTVLLFRNLYSI